MAVSVFDLLEIGIGPSSSRTVGPMRAARMFVQRLAREGTLARAQRLRVGLYGSLGATGKGHGSDKAVLLGLMGHEPDTVEVDSIPAILAAARQARSLTLAPGVAVPFDERADSRFHRRESLPLHPNGMRFVALDAGGAELTNRVYYSVGGGFIVGDEPGADGSRQRAIVPDPSLLPHPFHSGTNLLALTRSTGLAIAGLMRASERQWRNDAEVGCQGEVGVACSMAAGALCAVLGGTAEIGMEHHLGLTCDPVGGLVQIPCIERNAIASVKAINAARMALRGDGTHHVSLDQVIKTMRDTGADMMTKYKETARGGLAVNIVEC